MKEQLKKITLLTLQKFNFYETNKITIDDLTKDTMEEHNSESDETNAETADDTEGDESTSEDEQHVHYESKLYDREVKKRKRDAALVMTDSDADVGDDDGHSTDSSMTKNVKCHRQYQKPVSSKNTLCQKRAAMELIAATGQRQQGEQVYKKRKQAKDYKQILEVGDIGVIRVEGNTRAACDFPFLPVMVTSTRVSSKSGRVKYQICTQHGYLLGQFIREMIDYDEDMTPEVMKINPNIPGFQNGLTIAAASAKYNRLGGASFCKCTRDCMMNKTCSCVRLGKLCRPKCHGARKDGKEIKCTNCLYPKHLVVAKDVAKALKRK